MSFCRTGLQINFFLRMGTNLLQSLLFCYFEAINVCKQPTSIKRSPSGSTRNARSRECKITEEERHESDNGVEALQEIQELDKIEKLIERVEQISAKLNILDEIERKLNKLDSVEEKMKSFRRGWTTLRSRSHCLGVKSILRKKNKQR